MGCKWKSGVTEVEAERGFSWDADVGPGWRDFFGTPRGKD